MAWIRKGSISVASDLTTAALVQSASYTRLALDTLIDVTVDDAVGTAISSSPTVIAAAEAAVTGALETAGVVDGARNETWMQVSGADVFGALTDDGGKMSPYAWTPDGRVHPWGARIMREDVASTFDSFGDEYLWAITDERGRLALGVRGDSTVVAPGGISGPGANRAVVPVVDAGVLRLTDLTTGKISTVVSGGSVSGQPVIADDAVVFTVGSETRWARLSGGSYNPLYADKTKWSGWGSSTMAGLASNLSTAATSLGATFYNGGRSGELAEHTLARFGSRRATLAAFTIPASGSVDVVVQNIPDSVSAFSDTVTVQGVAGVLARVPGGVAPYTFTRSSSGSSVAVSAGTPAIPATSYRDGIIILNIGKNNFTPGGTSTQELVGWTIAAYEHATHLARQVLVVGHFHNTNTPASSDGRSRINAYNSAMRARFGTRFVDMAALVASDAIWAGTGLTPTPTDVAQQDLGNKPPSLSSDDGHLNAAGLLYVSNAIKAQIIALGWA